jgi:hypothetical protein
MRAMTRSRLLCCAVVAQRRLVVSERTVEWHIGNVLAKLESEDRSRTVAWVADQGLPLTDRADRRPGRALA